MKALRTHLLSFLLVLLGWTVPATGQIFGAPSFDPQLQWQTLETEHFRIHFHQGLEGVAQEAAKIAEESYAIIYDEFGQAPAKLDMFFVDAYDQPNGFSNPLADQVGIFTSQYRLSDWGNVRLDSWWHMVIFHELVHAIELDQTRGISQALRAILGKTILPNLVKPVPFIEGLAVYEKFKHKKESRLNDSRTRMMLRQMVLDNQLPSFDEITSYYSRASWPGLGLLVYNYGSWLMRYIEETYGKDAMRKLDEVNAKQPLSLLTFFGFGADFDTVVREALGVSIEELYRGFREWLREEFRPEIERIQGEGPTGALRISTLGFQSGQPAWSPDGQWIAYTHSGSGRAGLRLITPQGEDDHEIVSGGTVSHPTWSPDGKYLLYSKLDYDGPYYIHRDLYRYDRQAQREERLTWSERAYYGRFSPDSQKIYYAKNVGRDGSTALAVLDLATRQTRVLKEFPENTGMIHSFALSPDGQQIALALWRRGGYQDIYLMPASGGELTPVTQDQSQDADPVWSPDAQYLLFSSDPDRIYNLYGYRIEDGKFFKVTHVMSGSFYPTLAPEGKEIAFVSYTSDGYDVFRMPYTPQSWEPVEFTQETIPPWKGFPTSQYPIYPYNPWPLLLPKLWLPIPIPSGLGVVTSGFDPLFKHIYSAIAGWNLEANQPFYMLNYVNNEFTPVELFAHGDASGNSRGFKAFLPLSVSLDRQQVLTVGYELAERKPPQEDESDLPAKLRSTQTVSGSYSFRQSQRQDLFGDSTQISLAGQLFSHNGGNEWLKTIVLDWREVFRLPLRASQQLTLRIVAGWTDAVENEEKLKLGGPYGSLVLRGFKSGALVGRQAVSAGIQHHFPLFSIERSLGHWPLFLDDVELSLFVDAGMAGDQLDLREIHMGFGAELQLTFTMGYFRQFGLIAGVAQGLGQPQPVFYLNASLPELF